MCQPAGDVRRDDAGDLRHRRQLQLSADPPVIDDLFIATGFAIEPTLLATNAHVTETLTETIWPVPVERVVAVQAGTGVVVEITGAVAHPQYTGDPLGSPDVGLLRLAESVDEYLVVPAAGQELPAANGDTLALTGFPGDVQDWFTIEVGQTVPQATALTGAVTALRNFSPDVTVSAENVDVLQHQVPTTPGTSGSPLLACGQLVGVNNAGTVRPVISVDEQGELVIDRQAQASNNFGVHVKHLRQLRDQVAAGTPTFVPLPPPAPSFVGSYVGEAYGSLGSFSHDLAFVVDSENDVRGTATWSDITTTLTGSVALTGEIWVVDNGPDFGLDVATYVGRIDVVTGEVFGIYEVFPGDPALRLWFARRE